MPLEKIENRKSKLGRVLNFEFRIPRFAVADERPTRFYILSATVALAVMVAALVLLLRILSRPSEGPEALSAEQKAYLQQIVVSDARMSAAENFLGHTVTYLDAQVANKGTKAVRQLELELVFVDMLNQVVLRETARPVTLRGPALQPGQTRAFQVSFEHMPADWNQAPPTITPKLVQF
jgi:hypothetical protein